MNWKMKTHGVKKRSQNSKILFEMPTTTLVAMLMILFGIVGPTTAEPVTASYSGIVDTVDDPFEQLDGSVVVGGTFSGTYTFESTAENQGTSTFAQYLYDEEAPIGMTMTTTVGNYTFQTENFDLFNFTSNIYVKNNEALPPRDAYSAMTREITQTAGPDLGLGVNPTAGISIELITFANLSTFTDVNLPLTMPDLANFESTNRFTLDLIEVDALVRGHLTSLQTIGTIFYVDDDAPADPCHGNPDISDPLEDGSSSHPFDAIQEAISAAVTGDFVIVRQGTYRGNGNRDIDFGNKAITVRSTNPNDPNIVAGVIIDANGAPAELHWGFYFHSGENADSVLEGLTIMGGYQSYGAGIHCWSSSPTIRKCVIHGNTASVSGGGIYCANYSNPTIKDCTLYANTALQDGGGMYCDDSSPNFLNNKVISNQASVDGGGILCIVGEPNITDCNISDNTATEDGGGIYLSDGNAVVTSCTINRNQAKYAGGIVCVSGSASITDCNIIDNTAILDGGGVYCADSNSPTLRGCFISLNDANCAGGIICIDSNTNIIDCNIIGNEAWSDGGGLYIEDSSPTISNCTIQDNIASTDGGGFIYVRSELGICAGMVTDCSISENVALGEGGGLYISDSSPTVRRCWIGENGATYAGAFICVDGSALIADCNIIYNIATEEAGGVYCTSGNSPTIINCNITSNTAKYAAGIACAESDVNIIDCNISNNTALQDGGGVYISDSNAAINNSIVANNDANCGAGIICVGGSPIIADSNIIANTALADGGGFYCSDGNSPTLINSTINHNNAAFAAGILCVASNPDISGSIINDNNAIEDGGGVYCSDSDPNITNCNISGNYANYAAGVLCVYSDPNISDSIIADNNAVEDGGGLYCSDSNATVDNCTFTDNDANCGGGIICVAASPLIIDCNISCNTARTDGGGFYSSDSNSSPMVMNSKIKLNTAAYAAGVLCVASHPKITNTNIRRNSATEDGAGLYCSDSNPNVDNCDISDNDANYAAGVLCVVSNPKLSNCTIADNNTSEDGSGLYCDESDPNLRHCTFSGNIAKAGVGGAIFGYSGSNPTLTNSILHGNTATQGAEIALAKYDTNGTTITVGHSDVQGGYGGVYTETDCNAIWQEGNIDQEPNFVDPNNPDVSQRSYYLMPYSPCIDAGDPCTSYVGQTDIDGDPREWGDETDMGSDEVMRVQKQTLEQGQSTLLELGGGGSDPNEEVLVKFENISGPNNIGLTATKMRVDLHKEGTTKFEALKRTVIAETNLSKGDYLVTMTIPIDEEVLKNIKPLNTSMMYWDEVAQRWKHAVTNNSSPTEPRSALWLEKYPYHQPPTLEQLRLRGLGAHGVYWNPNEKKGFMWANVDHMTDFQAMAPKAGDFNVDGDVDPNDLGWFVGRWLDTNCQTTQDWCGGASIDNDESVDFVDFTMLAANWLESQ